MRIFCKKWMLKRKKGRRKITRERRTGEKKERNERKKRKGEEREKKKTKRKKKIKIKNGNNSVFLINTLSTHLLDHT